MRNKRTIAAILALILISSLFASCSQSSDETSPAATTQAQTETPPTGSASEQPTQDQPTEAVKEEAPPVEAPPAEPEAEVTGITYPLSDGTATLSFWTGWDQSNAAGQESIQSHVVFAEVEKQTGVHIKFTEVNFATRQEAFNLMVVGGDYCDILTSISSLYSGGVAKAVDDEVIITLNDYIYDNAPLYMELLDSNPDYKKSAMDDEGIISELSAFFTSFYTNGGWMIRQDFLDKSNLSMPETYTEWEDVLTQLMTEYDLDSALLLPAETNGLESGFGVSGFSASSDSMSQMQSFYQVDGVVKSTLLQPEYKEYLMLLNSWYNKGLINKEFFTIASSPMRGQIDVPILNNESAIWSANQFYILYGSQASDPDFSVSAIKTPVMNHGDVNKFGADMTNLKTMDSVSISSQCKDVALALQWLNYWFTDEGIMCANYGIEDLSYEYANGKPQFSEFMTNNPDGYRFSQMSSSYTYEHMPTLLDPARGQSTFTPEEVAAVEVWSSAQTGENMLPSNITLTTEESSQFALIFTDLQTYASEKVLKYVTGEESFESWDEFVEMTKTLKAEELVDIVQASLNRYNAR